MAITATEATTIRAQRICCMVASEGYGRATSHHLAPCWPRRAGGPRRSDASGSAAKPLVESCGGYASAVGGQRRTVAARGEWLPDLILARLRIRVVQALEVVGIGDRDLEPRRVRVDELAGGKEHTELLLPCRAPGQAWIREPAVRIEGVGRCLVVAVEDDPVEEGAGADDRSPGHVRHR